jgi:hypothetical protein
MSKIFIAVSVSNSQASEQENLFASTSIELIEKKLKILREKNNILNIASDELIAYEDSLEKMRHINRGETFESTSEERNKLLLKKKELMKIKALEIMKKYEIDEQISLFYDSRYYFIDEVEIEAE